MVVSVVPEDKQMVPSHTFLYRVRQIIFFWKMIIFLNFFIYLKVQPFRLIMKNNFIQMAASAGHAVAYTIGPIFKHIIDCVRLYFTNGFTYIVL